MTAETVNAVTWLLTKKKEKRKEGQMKESISKTHEGKTEK